MVAWGVSEGADNAFKICSYELGVMIIPTEPKRFPLPFTADSRRYRLKAAGLNAPDRPWGSGAVRERLLGANDCEMPARANIAECHSYLEKILRGEAAVAGGAPPTLLRQTFGELVSAPAAAAGQGAAAAASARMTHEGVNTSFGGPRAQQNHRAADEAPPRICLFLNLQPANGAIKAEHDRAVCTLWAGLSQLEGLVDSLFKGLWIGGVDGKMGHSELVARDMGILNLT